MKSRFFISALFLFILFFPLMTVSGQDESPSGVQNALFEELRLFSDHIPRYDRVESLLSQGADPLALNPEGLTSCQLALIGGYPDILSLLSKGIPDPFSYGREDFNNSLLFFTMIHPLEKAVSLCRTLLDQGFSPDIRDPEGNPLLGESLKHSLILTEMLLEAGADTEIRDSHGTSALMLAGSLENGAAAIDLLVRFGADLNARDRDGWNSLFYAVLFGGNILTVRSLVEHGINLDERDSYGSSVMLWAAAYLPDPLVLAYLAGQGASLGSRDKDGWTPLLASLNWGNEAQVVDFLSAYCRDGRIRDGSGRNLDALKKIYEEKRANPAPSSLEDLKRRRVYSLDSLPARELNTALHELAEWGGPLMVAEELLKAGADLFSPDKDGWTPLMKASAYNNPALVRLLLQEGSPVDYKNSLGWTALHSAAWSAYPETADLLLMAGAEVNSADRDGWTPLIWAARNQAPAETIQILLAGGAEAAAVTNNGESALYLMVSGWTAPRLENLILLLESGVEVNRTDRNGVSPLMKASALGYKEAVDLLMERGADPRLKDSYGNRAVDYALSGVHQEIADALNSY